MIDEGTILVSPFAGESDICPRDESGSFYSIDFRGKILFSIIIAIDIFCFSPRHGYFMYAREFISCNTRSFSTESLGVETDLLAWLYRWFEILTNTK